MQIITAMVFAILMLAIAFAPVSSSQVRGSSAVPHSGQPSGVIFADEPGTSHFPPRLVVTVRPASHGGGGGGYGDPHGS